MPSDQLGDGGGELIPWDEENLLLPSNLNHEQWLPSVSAPASNVVYYTSTSFENQPSFSDVSAGNKNSRAVPIASSSNGFYDPTDQTYEYIHAQHWRDHPIQENATSSAALAPVGSVGGLNIPLAFAESSPRDSIGSVGEVLNRVDGEQGPKQDFTISRSLLSPSRSVPPSKTPAPEPANPRRTSKPQREEPRVNQRAQDKSMNIGSGYNLPTAGQGSFDRKKTSRGSKGTPFNRLFSRNPSETQNEENQRRKQFGLTSRGPSRVSSISGLSQNETFSADLLDDELASSMARRLENRGVERVPGVLRLSQGEDPQNGQPTLPPAKGFSIQIGSESFKLSGASIMSDAPSYFSKFFEDQLQKGNGSVGTLYIDRDPVTFQDICRHLQGYYIQPRDGFHFVRLFADAQFYSLPNLKKQLFNSDIFIQIGGENFQIPRDVFHNTGDSPNFFSLGFAVFFSSPSDAFPGLDSAGLLRPPSVHPPCVPNRSAKVFSELLHLLRGYPLQIRSKEHRAELLRDCRYFNLRGLEQKLLVHDISYNAERGTSEIIIRLEDIKPSGVSFVGNASPSDRSAVGGWVNYSRPFVDETKYEIIVEICDESTRIDFRNMRADFYGDVKARISSLFQVVANKMNLPTNAPLGLMMSSGGAAQSVSPANTPLSEDRVKIRIDRDAHLVLDGEEYIPEGINFFGNQSDRETLESSPPPASSSSATWPVPSTIIQQHSSSSSSQQFPAFLNFAPPPRPQSTSTHINNTNTPPPRKRKRRGSLDDFGEWMIRKGQWRLRVQPRMDTGMEEGSGMEIVMHAVKLDAMSGQKGRNALRKFLA